MQIHKIAVNFDSTEYRREKAATLAEGGGGGDRRSGLDRVLRCLWNRKGAVPTRQYSVHGKRA